MDLRNSTYSEGQLLPFLVLLQSLPIRSITIRSNIDIGEESWTQLQKLRNLQHVALLVTGGPPRILKGWSESLGNSLTSLELDVSLTLQCQTTNFVENHIISTDPLPSSVVPVSRQQLS
jgi:hypothetical protein